MIQLQLYSGSNIVILRFIDFVVSGFEEPVYTVSEEDGSIMLCADLASPVVERNGMVTFQTIAVSNSAIRKLICSKLHNSMHIHFYVHDVTNCSWS